MGKQFNVTGTCIPKMHYMVDISKKLDKIIKLVENGEYFIINRPRQYGKTTSLYPLDKRLKDMEEYLSIKISFEAIDTESYSNAYSFLSSLMQQIKNYFRFSDNKRIYAYIKDQSSRITSLNEFSNFITDLVEYANKKIVLIIDEVDKSSNNQLFLDFLGMFRNKYLLRNEGKDYTFQSVILAGVHDVKNMKLKIRQDEEHKYNSPWNIASDFEVDMSFSKEEIETMLEDYISSTGVILDKEYFSDRLYFYTSGYPFLVSKLCKLIDEKLMKEGELFWKKEYIDIAVKLLLKESNTNFDTLIKNIENNKDLKDLIKKLIIDGSEITFNKDNPIIALGLTYGFFKGEEGKLKLHNRIYEQLIYDYMSSFIETSMKVSFYNV